MDGRSEQMNIAVSSMRRLATPAVTRQQSIEARWLAEFETDEWREMPAMIEGLLMLYAMASSLARALIQSARARAW